MATCSDPDSRTPLLNDAVRGSVDYRGRPSLRSHSGRWRSAAFVLGLEIAERFAFFGISSNLITYLTGNLGQSMASAAQNVNIWCGTASLLPLLGASLADSFLGRYPTILLASALYILGLSLLTLSTMLTSEPPGGGGSDGTSPPPPPPPLLHVMFFFFSLYLVAFAQGGHKPCVQAFGADQFEGEDSKECRAKWSFFNWWHFGTSAGAFVALIVLNYIEDNLGWGLGFGIPCVSLLLALLVFLLGTPTYRFVTTVTDDRGKPLARIGRVFVNAARNRRTTTSLDILVLEEGGQEAGLSHRYGQLSFLNKALATPDGSDKNAKVCSVSEVEEAKAVLRLVPIWATSLPYAIILSQCSTFFTKQGATMDRSITPTFKIPAASIQCFGCISIVLFVPVYDRVVVPIAREFTLKPSGITKLQRIGVGMFISTVAMVVAALVETKRLTTAREHSLTDHPSATVPITVWWLIPQFILLGVSTVFTVVGLQEFFYDQMPSELKSVGLALCLSVFGVGNLLSGCLVSTIEDATGGYGRESWFTNNLNRAHLHYFYWLLAGVGEVGLVVYMYFANSYVNKYNVGRSRV